MKKIISLFKRDFEGNRLVYDEITEGAEWVIAGEGRAMRKYDGTACMLQGVNLFKRYDRKLTKAARKKKNPDESKSSVIDNKDYKVAPAGWIACEESPNQHTGHWPGWLPISEDSPEDKYHREALRNLINTQKGRVCDKEWYFQVGDYDGTYELCGEKIQSNTEGFEGHWLIPHLSKEIEIAGVPLSFEGLREWFEKKEIEGVVWHRDSGEMVKIKRKDFGYAWPI